MIITSYNPDIPEQEVTFLSLPVGVGGTTLTVKNNDEFANGDRILVGKPATETAEMVYITGVVTHGTSLQISATTFSHSADEPITRLRFDQVKFYRSITTSTGIYTVLANTPIDIDWDGAEGITTFDDATGLAGYFYKVSYYNSVTTLESTLSDPMPGTGYGRNTVGFLYDEFTREVNDQNNILVDPVEFLGWMNQVNDEIILNSRKPLRFLHARKVYQLNAATEAVPLPTDSAGNLVFRAVDMIGYYYTNPIGSVPVISPSTQPQTPQGTVQLYPMRYIIPEQFRLRFQDQNFITDDQVKYYTIDTATNEILFQPLSTDNEPGALYIWYWKFFDEIKTFGQKFETPIYQVYKQFALYRYFLKKAENDTTYAPLWQEYKANYTREIIKLTKYNDLQVGQPRGFEFGSDTSANTYDRVVQPRKGFRRF